MENSSVLKTGIKSRSVILDTKPFVLYVIGSIDQEYVEKFIGTKEFEKTDFFKLKDFLLNFEEILVTPYILSEFSHFTLEKNIRDDYKKILTQMIVSLSRSSKVVTDNPAVDKIFSNAAVFHAGASDASLLEINTDSETPIITSDGLFADKARATGKTVYKFMPVLGFVSY